MFDASMFTLFYPEPPDQADLDNLKESAVRRVMLLWGAARNPRWLDQYKGLDLVLRMQPEDLRDPFANQAVLYNALDRGARIVAVIMGNEPDAPFDLRWRLPSGQDADWGNKAEPGRQSPLDRRMEQIFQATEALADVADERGVTLVSPAYIMRGYTEDDPPDPGLFTWRELSAWCYYGYNSAIGGSAVHFYDDGWVRPLPEAPNNVGEVEWLDYTERRSAVAVANATNVQRWMQAVRFWSGFHHHLTWWDEVNCHGHGLTANERMWSVTSKAEMLIRHTNPEGYRLGERIAMFCPFTSNGTGDGYPAQYIMRDRDAYTTVRRFMEAYPHA